MSEMRSTQRSWAVLLRERLEGVIAFSGVSLLALIGVLRVFRQVGSSALIGSFSMSPESLRFGFASW
jgi:predicted membrane protein